jgi:hypothetical protein
MRVRIILTTTAFVFWVFLPLPRGPLRSPPTYEPPAFTQNASVTGRISSIGDASFSVEAKKSQDLVTVEFLIDDETTIVGKLKSDPLLLWITAPKAGNNIARHIVVRSAIHSH